MDDSFLIIFPLFGDSYLISMLFFLSLFFIQLKFDLTIRYIYSMTTFVLKRRTREKKKNTNIKSIEIEIDFYFSTQSKYNRLASWNTNGFKENHIELNTKSFFSFERTISSLVSLTAVNAKTNTNW